MQAAGVGGEDVTQSNDLSGGLTRSEADYLKTLNELKMLEADRAQKLNTYRPEHEIIKEIDANIAKAKAMITIQAEASGEEWDRRKRSIQAKLEGLAENIKDAEAKARDAHVKIVQRQSLEGRTSSARMKITRTGRRPLRTSTTLSSSTLMMSRSWSARRRP